MISSVQRSLDIYKITPNKSYNFLGSNITELFFEFLLTVDNLSVLGVICKEWNKIYKSLLFKKLTPFEVQAYDHYNAQPFINETKPWVAAIPKPLRIELFERFDRVPVITSIPFWNSKRSLDQKTTEMLAERGYKVDDKTVLVPLSNDSPELSKGKGKNVDYCYSTHGHMGTPEFNGPGYLPYDIVKRCLESNSRLLVSFRGHRIEITFAETAKQQFLELEKRTYIESYDEVMYKRNPSGACFQEDVIAEINDKTEKSK